MADENKENRIKRYSDFLRGMKIVNEGKDGGAGANAYRLEGNMYTETSLFRIVRMLD